MPAGVWTTSGWNCRPYRPRSTDSIAATGETGVWASTLKPAGALVMVSPWLIHTVCSSGRSSSRTPSSSTVRSVLPYSRTPVGSTVPPSERAISCVP